MISELFKIRHLRGEIESGLMQYMTECWDIDQVIWIEFEPNIYILMADVIKDDLWNE